MDLTRRAWLRDAPLGLASMLMSRGAHAQPSGTAVPFAFPADHGAHLQWAFEWWALKGEIAQVGPAPLGFHISFCRMAIASSGTRQSNFSPRHVLAARMSITDSARGLVQDQCAARVGFGVTDAPEGDLALKLRDWSFTRSGTPTESRFAVKVYAPLIAMSLTADQSQPPLLHAAMGQPALQGGAAAQASHYYSIPALSLAGEVATREKTYPVSGKAWFDHGWANSQMLDGAAGMDWFGLHMHDRSSLMVTRLRRPDGSLHMAAATMRHPARPDKVFGPGEFKARAMETWTSPATGAAYPVVWQLDLGTTSYLIKARIKNQEMDGGIGIGDVFWEGLCDVHDLAGKVLGGGVLEMTGYVRRGTPPASARGHG